MRYVTTLIVLTVLGGFAAPALAQANADREQRAEFMKLVTERNRLVVELRQLDEKAADLIKQGREPVSVHAEQVAVQDRLDLVNLRIELLATRQGYDIPPVPAPPSRDADDGDGERSTAGRAAFARGRSRALAALERQTFDMLRRINYQPFLNGTGEGARLGDD